MVYTVDSLQHFFFTFDKTFSVTLLVGKQAAVFYLKFSVLHVSQMKAYSLFYSGNCKSLSYAYVKTSVNQTVCMAGHNKGYVRNVFLII